MQMEHIHEKNKLFTIENRQDILRHTLSCTWEFSTEIKLKKFTITAKRQPFSLPLKLIPYAFFEEVLAPSPNSHEKGQKFPSIAKLFLIFLKFLKVAYL